MRRLAGDGISWKKMLCLTGSVRVLGERIGENPEDDTGVCVKGRKKAGGYRAPEELQTRMKMRRIAL
jgi:hypothetical protein